MNVNHLGCDGLPPAKEVIIADGRPSVFVTPWTWYISGLKPVGSKDTQKPRRSIIRELERNIPISFRQNYGSRAHRAFVVDKYAVAHVG